MISGQFRSTSLSRSVVPVQCNAHKGFGSGTASKRKGTKSGLSKTPQQVGTSHHQQQQPFCLKDDRLWNNQQPGMLSIYMCRIVLHKHQLLSGVQAADRALAEASRSGGKARPIDPKEAARGKVDYVQVRHTPRSATHPVTTLLF